MFLLLLLPNMGIARSRNEQILPGFEMEDAFNSVAGVPTLAERMQTLILTGISPTALMGSCGALITSFNWRWPQMYQIRSFNASLLCRIPLAVSTTGKRRSEKKTFFIPDREHICFPQPNDDGSRCCLPVAVVSQGK